MSNLIKIITEFLIFLLKTFGIKNIMDFIQTVMVFITAKFNKAPSGAF